MRKKKVRVLVIEHPKTYIEIDENKDPEEARVEWLRKYKKYLNRIFGINRLDSFKTRKTFERKMIRTKYSTNTK